MAFAGGEIVGTTVTSGATAVGSTPAKSLGGTACLMLFVYDSLVCFLRHDLSDTAN